MQPEVMVGLLVLGCVVLIGIVAVITDDGSGCGSESKPCADHPYCDKHQGFVGCISTFPFSGDVECCPEGYSCSDTLYLNCSNKED